MPTSPLRRSVRRSSDTCCSRYSDRGCRPPADPRTVSGQRVHHCGPSLPASYSLSAPSGMCKPRVQRQPPARDDRPGAVVDLPVALVLIEAEVQEGPDEVAGLRTAAGDDPRNLIGQRIRRALGIARRIAEERRHVTKRGVPDAEHVRVPRGEHDLVEQLGIEAALHANLRRVGRSGKRVRRAAARPCPIGRRNRALPTNLAVDGLGRMRRERRACVSRLAGLYGTGFAFTSIGCESGPLALTIRPITGPVIGEPSRFFATGTVT